MNKLILFFCLMLTMLSLSQRANAASAGEFSDSDLSSVDVSKQKRINIKFGDEFVKGQEEHPSAEYIFERKQFNFKKMIQLREDFVPEVEKGKDEFGGF